MIQNICKFVPNNKKTLFGVFGVVVLCGYLIGRTRIPVSSNKLTLSLEDLLKWQVQPSVKRIVITESSNSNGQVRKKMVDFMKKQLNEKKVKVLVNCSPQQLLSAGSSSFINNVQKSDKKWIDYYLNAFKTQILIEKTILDIDNVTRQQSKDQIIIMICDNNILDIKTRADEWRWAQFVSKYNIDEQKLMKSYNLVIHIVTKQSDIEQQKISQVWKGHPRYYTLNAYQKQQQECVKEGLKIIQGCFAKKQ